MINKTIDILHVLKHNVIVAILLSTIFIIGEQIFRVTNQLLTFNLSFDIFLEYFFINIIIISLSSKRAMKGIYLFIILMMFFQFVHFNYYGTWIFPLEFLLFFTKFSETISTFTTVFDIALFPIVIVSTMSIVIFKILSFLSEDRIVIKYLPIVLVVFIVFIPARVIADGKSRKGSRPNIEVTPIVNTIETLGYLFGRIIPQKITGESGLTQEIVSTPKIKIENPDANVIVIMGESLTWMPMSLYGEKDKTTPNLDKLKNDKNFLYQIAFSSGTMTDVSLPSFFNMLDQPDSTPQIMSTNTCLFKMAKKNGFETYFYSAQSRDGLSNIKSYLCLGWVDNYLDGTHNTDDIKVNALDEVLINRLNNINFNKSNFIVLHQIGSHSPYKLRYPEEFDKFESNLKDKRDLGSYKNSILYTDHLISKVIETLKKNTSKPTYVFFTSDHGEGVDNHSGHGNLKVPSNYEVPFLMYQINTNKELDYNLKNSKYTSHYEISKFIAKMIGYDVSTLKKYNNIHTVCGRDLSGVDGHLKIKMNKNIIESKKVIY